MNASGLGNAVLLASLGICVLALPVAPAFAVTSLITGVAIKAGMDKFVHEAREAKGRRNRRKNTR